MDLGQCCNLYSAALRIVRPRAIFKGQSRTSESSVVPKLTVGGGSPALPPTVWSADISSSAHLCCTPHLNVLDHHILRVWLNNRSKAHERGGISLPAGGPASALRTPASAGAMSNEAVTQG